LSPEEIAKISAAYSESTEENNLLFARTEDEIEDVYLRGPDSCMSHPQSDYRSPFHPVRVYAAGDLAIAYIERKRRTDVSGRVTARTICWPEKKIYNTIYGDNVRLSPLLEKLGYKRAECYKFDGAKLLKKKHLGQVVVPYVDCSNGIGDGGKHLVLGGEDYTSESTNGLSGEDRETCPGCGDCIGDSYVSVYTRRGESQTYCAECCDEVAVHCEGEDIHVHRDCSVAIGHDGDAYMSEWYYDQRGRMCDHCENAFHRDDLNDVATRDGTQQWCEHCRDNDAATCADTGDLYDSDALVTTPHGKIVGFDTVAAIPVEENAGRRFSVTVNAPNQAKLNI
jgi:hypothetical protein